MSHISVPEKDCEKLKIPGGRLGAGGESFSYRWKLEIQQGSFWSRFFGYIEREKKFHTPAGRQREVTRERNLLSYIVERASFEKNYTVAKIWKLYAVDTGLLVPVSRIHRDRGEKKKGCNSETSAQIALKMKFGKEKVLIIKEKGKIKFISSKRASEAIRAERREKAVTGKLALRSLWKWNLAKRKC